MKELPYSAIHERNFTLKHINHVEEGQRQRRLSTARSPTNAHLGDGKRGRDRVGYLHNHKHSITTAVFVFVSKTLAHQHISVKGGDIQTPFPKKSGLFLKKEITMC